MSLAVTYDKETCLPLLLSRLPGAPKVEEFGEAFDCIGFIRDGKIVAAALFSGFSGFNVFLSLASVSPFWATKKSFRTLSEHAFNELGVVRVTSCVPGNLPDVHRLNARLGFKFEGIRRRGWDGTIDLFEFGMLKEECPWLQQEKA